MAPQTPDLGGQGVRQRSEAAFPGAAAGILALLGQQRAQQLHLGGGLVQHREQFMDRVQVPDDHDHQGFQKQPIRVHLGTTAAPFQRWWGRRQSIYELDEHDKERDLAYHSSASVSNGRATSMMRRRPRYGQALTRPSDL